MVSFRELKCFYFFFHVFGQAPYYPLHVKNRIKSKILMFLPLAMLIVNAVLCSVLYLKTEYNNTKKARIVSTMRFTAFIPNFVLICEILIHPYGVHAINQRLFFISHSLTMKLKTQFRMDQFKSECIRDFCMCFAMLMLTYIIRMNFPTVYELNTELAIFSMQLFKTIAIIHLLFYMNLFKFILISMNEAILESDFESIVLTQVGLNVGCRRSKRQSFVLLQKTRFIYLKLWEVIKMYNQQFGWSLIAIMVESIISTTNALYAAFIYFTDSDDFIQQIIRKFLFISLLVELFYKNKCTYGTV